MNIKYLLFLVLLVSNLKLTAQSNRTFKMPKTEDFEEIILADKLIEIYFSIPMNKYLGNLGDFTNLGGGMTVGMLFGQSKFRVGFDMSMYFNGKKESFVIDSPRPQHDNLPAIYLGLSATRNLYNSSKSNLNVQVNLSYVQMNITKKIDNEWDKFSGFSPGIRFNYVHKIWKPKTSLYYGMPSLLNNALQVHVGLSPVFMSDRQGNGLNFEIGLGYRMIVQQIQEYRMKEKKEIYRL